MISSSLVDLTINDILNLIAISLSRKTNFNDQEFLLREFLMENVLNVSSLTSTCWSNKEWLDFIHDEELKHVTVSDCINSSNNYITWNGILWELINLILVREFHPIFPFICIWNIAVVIYCTSVELTWKNLVLQFSNTFERTITDLFEMKVKWFSEFGVNANAERPDGSKEEA